MIAIAEGLTFASAADEKSESHVSVIVETSVKFFVVTREMMGGIVWEMMMIWSDAGA